MALRKERDHYKATRRAIAAVTSTADLKEKLGSIVRNVALVTDFSASLMLLDSSGKKLVHTVSTGLPQFYVRKGFIDIEKATPEANNSQPVIIKDSAQDSRVQYPEVTKEAGIVSILGIPVIANGTLLGSLRVYTREPYDFNSRDISFVTAMANLAALALSQDSLNQKTTEAKATEATAVVPLQAKTVKFAHPSEAEFARLLDFYNIEWVYEPRSFPLHREDDRITEMFTPDFYLPSLDLYVELTTMKQNLVTRKNRKLRVLKELYPDVKITLLYKHDYDRLLARYGCGPLAHTRAHGIKHILFSAEQIDARVKELAGQISRDYADRRPILVGIQRGFICFLADLIRQITVPIDMDIMAASRYRGGSNATVKITKDLDLDVAGRHVIIIEDIVDTGITLSYILSHLRTRKPASLAVCALLDKRVRRLMELPLDYIAFEAPDEFVVGYGLDYREEYRNLPFIGIPNIEQSPEAEVMPQVAE